MENISTYINTIFSDTFYKMIISKPKDKSDKIKKAEITPLKNIFQLTRYEGRQVFHQNLSLEETKDCCIRYLGDIFLQINAWDASYEYSIIISKKGAASFSRRLNKVNNQTNIDSRHNKANQLPINFEHNRKKNYILQEGTVIQPLIDMGIFTVTGQVVKSKYDKFKQINRFIEMIDDVIKDDKPINIIDFGCGKSYLTFIIYYYFTFVRKIDVSILGLDLKEDVIKRCNESAQRYGYEKLRFEIGDIESYAFDNHNLKNNNHDNHKYNNDYINHNNRHIDMVISLHACDTATDYALYNAITWNAKYIFSVPCCQHELNKQIKSPSLSIFNRYGIVQERTAALMTDAIRANILDHFGYRTQLLEFVDFEHTPKNILIRAVKTNRKLQENSKALQEVLTLMKEFNFQMTLFDLLKSLR